MTVPGIKFETASPALAVDPNRMDIAMFVGFLPLREGAAAQAARARQAELLSKAGWSTRADDTLTDVPVRVRSIEEVEEMFDTGGRMTRDVKISSAALPTDITIDLDSQIFALDRDGVVQSASLPLGATTRSALVDTLVAAFPDLSITEGDAVGGLAPIHFDDPRETPGVLNINANPALGFPMAARSEAVPMGCPTGVALRAYFAEGGREAVLVRMGTPTPLYFDEAQRVAAISTLIGGGFGAGADDLAALAGLDLPSLPPEYPTRDPWHGLAHLHGLDDVSMVLMPDLPELISARFALEAEEQFVPRPKEAFTVCTPADDPVFNGAFAHSDPAYADETGQALWAKTVAWAVQEVARITPEVKFIAAVPNFDGGDSLADMLGGSTGTPLNHHQLQLVTPWVKTDIAHDMPAMAAAGDGVLAGVIAHRTLNVGSWRTVAGQEPRTARGFYNRDLSVTHENTPQVSVLGIGINGPEILSDRTTDPTQYNQANIRRLMALIIRAARHRGTAAIFDPNGPLFWRDVAMPITTILRQLHSAGALRGLKQDDAFSVVIGRETMNQEDIDAGRAIAEITVCPAHSIEEITINLSANGTVGIAGGGA